MTGNEYKRLIAQYVVKEYGSKVKVYDEVNIGTSIIGKQRRVDFLIVEPFTNRALAIECKYQDSNGTADEKIPYTLQDMATLRMPAAVVYAGVGFSEGVLHLLQSSEYAAYCQPSATLGKLARQKGQINSGTWQLDHVLAVTFQWWDLLIGNKPEVVLTENFSVPELVLAENFSVPEVVLTENFSVVEVLSIQAADSAPVEQLPALAAPSLAAETPEVSQVRAAPSGESSVRGVPGFETQLSLHTTKAKVPFGLVD